MDLKNNTLAIALASLLVGGVAVAAFQNNRDSRNDLAANANSSLATGDVRADEGAIPSGGKVEYAQVISVDPITEKQQLYAQVIGTEPVRETSTTSTPHQVCNDVVVQQRMPERDGNVGGTVAGALIGGLVGNQVGGGTGRKLATAGGAVAGGFIGNRVDRNHVGGQVVNRTDRQCHSESSTSQSSRTVAYNVTYRNPDGTTGTMRTGSKPGSRIALGSEDKTIAYDVTYRYDGQERTVRMDDKPGDRLPVIDGQVVTQVAAVDDTSGTTRQ
ncbi:MAG: glycine zipper 2TM domain-containing protein [Luteimonas sp.]